MAELRTAEHRLLAVCQLYNGIRSDERSNNQLPLQKHALQLEASQPDAMNESIESFTDLLDKLEVIRKELAEMLPSVERFRKRFAEKDPVTGNPRYGAKTQARVSALLSCYEELEQILASIFESDFEATSSSEASQLLETVKAQAEQERSQSEENAKRVEQEEKERLEQIAREEREKLFAQQKAEEEAKREIERQQEEQRRRRQEARDAERRVRDEAQQADREWARSIPKGPDGVREQLRTLLESTSGNMEAQRGAVGALHVIFSQICSHPEEANFRRVRRDHPKFNQDIGQYPGGKEFLIAAGFQLAEIDGVPSFLSKEPNLETDMDRWSEWFDLLKATLQILDDHMKKR